MRAERLKKFYIEYADQQLTRIITSFMQEDSKEEADDVEVLMEPDRRSRLVSSDNVVRQSGMIKNVLESERKRLA